MKEKEEKSSTISEGDDSMIASTVKKENIFAEFLKTNQEKIQKITPKNPIIKKDDEWAKETFWDNDYKE